MRKSLAIVLLAAAVAPAQERPQERPPPPFETDSLKEFGTVIGLEFTEEELKLMLRGAIGNLRTYERMRDAPLDNGVAPALHFTPFAPGVKERPSDLEPRPIALPETERPKDLEQLAFADIKTLASLVKTRKVSCVELTTMYLKRLRRHDATLKCVVTYTEERALAQAKKLDEELAAGKWRGLLHGIPWGAKDLLAVKGYPTTWGAKPYEKQVLDFDATVVKKLDEAGAVLIAKLTLGALAMGDVWFGGRTNNPWNPEQGSSGSSAGPAAATAAGCVAFAIGSETLGSIVSPSVRCGCSSLRPTFGRVSRAGAMTLCWSMDKLGPMCRSAEDAAIVFAAIHGADGEDISAVDRPFAVTGRPDVKGWKVGYLKMREPPEGRGRRRGAAQREAYQRVLADLRELGVELVEFQLPRQAAGLRVILNAEAAAAFDELTRSGRDDELVRQGRGAWPNSFRTARLIPAVEYIQANRQRTKLMQELDKSLEHVGLFVHPTFFGLGTMNLTGHPTAVVPAGFRENGTPYSICFSGRLMWDDRVLALVQAWQAKTDHHKKHPREGS